jgi:hypothetical protein
MTLMAMALNGCGGGGGGTSTNPTPATAAKTTATLVINLTGMLPTNTTIAGTDFTITLPANVTPALTGGVVATGVVTPTGTFAGSTLAPQIVYNAATSTLKVIQATSVLGGVTQVGEVVTIVLQLANNAAPTVADFPLSLMSVIDAGSYSSISGMGAVVSSVTLN